MLTSIDLRGMARRCRGVGAALPHEVARAALADAANQFEADADRIDRYPPWLRDFLDGAGSC